MTGNSLFYTDLSVKPTVKMSGESVFLKWQILKIGFSIFTDNFLPVGISKFSLLFGPALTSILLVSHLFPLVFKKCWYGIEDDIPLSPFISSVFKSLFLFVILLTFV